MRFGKTFAVPERHTLTRVPQPTSPVHKLVITGTGRTGTTFLVQILTELGLDTGYTQAKLSDDYFEHCSAGLERDMLAEDSPYVVKNPAFCQTLPALLATGRFAVDHVLVPIRDLDDAAQSRIRIGGQDGDVPGGLMGTSDPAAQKGVLAERFHRLMHTLAANDIPCTLLHFPRFVLDADYAWSKLRFLTPGLERGAFDEAFQRVAHPELIHQFAGPSDGEPGHAAGQFLRAHQRKRVRRRAKRLLAAVAIIAAAVLAARLYATHERQAAQAAQASQP
jgi:hypothetical protein